MTSAEVVVHPDADLLAKTVAARLVARLVDVQSTRGHAHIGVTGGGVGTAVLRELAAAPARDAVDWAALHIWWGDERFLPAGHPDRNETQARAALLDHVPVDPAHVHAIGDSDAYSDADEAAQRYEDELAQAAESEEDAHGVPSFDVLMLGVGEEGHVASIFPESPAAHESSAAVVAVHGCPKPPPVRVSMTFPTINRAHEVWLLAAGAAKAGAIELAFDGAGGLQLPAAGVAGAARTIWLVDRAAAAKLPASIRAPR